MNSLARCCLITIRFESDLGQAMALCACFPVESFHALVAEAFAHRIFSRLDESAKAERVAHALERHLLVEAGVAAKSQRATAEAFFTPGEENPIVSQWMDLELSGKVNGRKSRVLESALRDWMEQIFPVSHCCLPSSRPIPLGTAADLGALRAGWRAEAEARGISAPAPCAAPPPSPEFADPASDGFPSGTKSRRKKA